MDIFESGICPLTGVKLEIRDEWQLNSGDYSCKVGVLAKSIIIAEPKGKSTNETTLLFIDTFEKIINTYPKTPKFILIDNYSKFKKATHEARRTYMKYLNNHKKIAMIIYMGLSRSIYLSISMGKMINYLNFSIKVSKNYKEAVEEAIKELDSLKIENNIFSNKKTIENNTKKLEFLDHSEEINKIIEHPAVNKYISGFNKYLAQIEWSNYNYELPEIPGISKNHPLNSLRTALSVVKFDVSELMKEFITQETKLIESQENLKELNANLENLVKLRTNELLRVNKELKKAKEEAERANKGKAVFLASISHELKTPLNSIMGYSSLGISKIDKISKEKVSNYFYQINTSGKRLLSLLTDLIDITKFEAGAMSFSFQENNIVLTVKKAISEISPLAERKNININLSNNLENPSFIFDTFRILQVFINILSNSVKFTEDNKNIYINLEENDNEFICSIKDEGVGLEENELELIFNLFKMGKKSSNSSGTGLGLAISRSIIIAHDGKIWAKNNKNKGAVFTFTISKKLNIK